MTTTDDLAKLLDRKFQPLEQWLANLEGKITRVQQAMATKDDLKALEKQMTTKEDLKKVEKRIIKKLDYHFNYLDKEIMKDRNRLDRIEVHLELPRIQP
jgi:hypothetical protein